MTWSTTAREHALAARQAKTRKINNVAPVANKAMSAVLKKSIIHKEGHHVKHAAIHVGHNSANSHRIAHHSHH